MIADQSLIQCLSATLPRPRISATQGRQFIPFWGSLLWKLGFCLSDIHILITFPSSHKFAFWSYAEYSPLLLPLVPGLGADEQLCFHGWDSVLCSTSHFASFFVPLSLEGMAFKHLKQFITKFGGRKTWVFVWFFSLLAMWIWANWSYLNFLNLSSFIFKMG